MSYQKLVRDRIPEIIKQNGQTPITRVLSNDEYLKELNIKIQEELNEYLESGNVEELADLEEVIRAILDVKGVSIVDFEVLRIKKAVKRGAFKQKVYLEGIEEE